MWNMHVHKCRSQQLCMRAARWIYDKTAEGGKDEILNEVKWAGKQEVRTVKWHSSGIPFPRGRHERTNQNLNFVFENQLQIHNISLTFIVNIK